LILMIVMRSGFQYPGDLWLRRSLCKRDGDPSPSSLVVAITLLIQLHPRPCRQRQGARLIASHVPLLSKVSFYHSFSLLFKIFGSLLKWSKFHETFKKSS
jgi:hypothetical protein